MAVLLLLAFCSLSFAFAEQEAFPSIAYYEERQQQARDSPMLGWTPEPLPEFAINVNENPKCNEWLRIDGQVPYNDGILMSALIGQYDIHGDGKTYVKYQNHPNEWGKGTFGYVFIPCGEGDFHLVVNYYHDPTVFGVQLEPLWERTHVVLEVQQ